MKAIEFGLQSEADLFWKTIGRKRHIRNQE
ncbi:unnamed protein product [Nezara viridula]|uniref:Uncharacterized protein n=1 Tax=Nezara viridula TaxID=85310 RepID=A0A9P0E552_NEZVI|nr:unnamed protein product [Nezara viridula]